MTIEKIKIDIKRENNNGVIPVRAMLYKYKKTDKNYTMKFIKQVANDVRRDMKKKGLDGYIQLSLKTDTGYYPSKRFDFGAIPIDLKASMIQYTEELEKNPFVDDSIKSIRSFGLFVVNTSKTKKGGCEPGKTTNNCLWKCLMISNVKKWLKPAFLRKFLNVPKNAPIDYRFLGQIENEMCTGIYLTGDFARSPSRTFQKNIYLKLKDGHYSIDKQNGYKMEKTYIHSERKIIIFQKNDDGYSVCSEDGEKQVDKLNFDINKYIKINFNEIKKIAKKQTIQDAYDWVIEQIEAVNEATEGKINMFKTGWIGDTIMHHLKYELNKTHIEFDAITENEFKWFESCKMGAYMQCTKGEFENVYEYDQKSSYPSHLIDSHFNIPVKSGLFKIINVEEFNKYNGKFVYGIYRCVIDGDDRRFKYNPNNYYTHFDLEIAHKLNLNITLIEDEEPNCLLYPASLKKTTSGSNLFKEYVNWIYKFKSDNPDIPIFKMLLSTLWGTLCRTYTNTYYHEIDNTITCELKDNEEIIEFSLFSGKTMKIKTIENNRIYRTPLARLKPFLLARQRMQMFTDVLEPYYDDIIEIRTDGILSLKKLPFEKQGNIGDIVFKGKHKKVVIQNINNIKKF